MIANYIHYKVWGVIAYTFLNVNRTAAIMEIQNDI